MSDYDQIIGVDLSVGWDTSNPHNPTNRFDITERHLPGSGQSGKIVPDAGLEPPPVDEQPPNLPPVSTPMPPNLPPVSTPMPSIPSAIQPKIPTNYTSEGTDYTWMYVAVGVGIAGLFIFTFATQKTNQKTKK